MSSSVDATPLVRNFRAALLALQPIFDESDIAPGGGDSGDRYDTVAEALWDVLVLRRLAESFGDEHLLAPRYGYPPLQNEGQFLVQRGGGAAPLEFVELVHIPEITTEPFGVVMVRDPEDQGHVFALDATTKFIWVPSSGTGNGAQVSHPA